MKFSKLLRALAPLSLSAFIAPSLSATGPEPRLGAMTHFAQGWSPDWAWVAAMRSIGTVRDELYWNVVESTKGVYSFPIAYDSYMETLRIAGIEPLIVLSFENPNYDCGATPYTDAGCAAYGRYGVEVLRHYGSQIKAVEIWNEYNGTFCSGPATADRAGTYTKMLGCAYAKLKAERPDLTVLGGATIGTPSPYWEKLLQAGALASMDAISVHPYRYNAAPEGIENDITALQTLVKKYNNGQPKPIWVTEIGWGIQDGSAAGQLAIDEATQAKFLVRAYSLLLSAGVERVYWYLLRDYQDFTMGLTYADATPKLSAYAMQVMIAELTGNDFVKRDPTADRFYSLLFTHTGGPEVRVVWSLDPVTIDASGATRIVDLQGRTFAPTAQLAIGDSPLFIEGPVAGLPPAPANAETLIADSARDFCGAQSCNGWSFGDFVGASTTFEPLTNYSVTDWTQVWGGAYPYLSVATGDQHPSTTGTQPVSAVRRWTSSYEGTTMHIVGKFQCNVGGDGVGVSILVDGQRLFREILGASGGGAIEKDFDFLQVVHTGTTIDFVVDPGPGNDINFDATAVNATLSVHPTS